MPIVFDVNHDTGVVEYFDYDPIKDEVRITAVQDAKCVVDQSTTLRNDEEYSKKGIKGDWWHYCTIPPIVEMQLRSKGINIWDRGCTKALLREINQNYPWLKATNKTHA